MDIRLASILIEEDSNGILRNVPNMKYIFIVFCNLPREECLNETFKT